MNAFCVALTGGIASGKSATAQRFTRHGVPVYDADQAAHDLTAPGTAALAEIVTTFGPDCLRADGTLDRPRLRAIVFADVVARRRLESILHPPIHHWLLARARACTQPYCILAVPLLVECWDDYAWVDRVLVTDVPPAVQLERLRRRPGIDATLARQLLAAQASRAQRLAVADDVLDNTGPLQSLDSAVDRLHRFYTALAAKR
jgi:dephospho-CoA kinase